MTNIKEKVCIPEEKDYRLVFSKADTIIEEHSLGELLEDLEKGYIVDDIAMQRDSGLWSSKDSSLLIHTVLKGLSIYPISLDQEDTGSGQIKRLTDGKQRLNVFESYKNNEFSLYKFTPSVTVKGLKMTPKLNDDGEVVKYRNKVVMEPELDENGETIVEEKTYKIAGKFFSQLPDDLQYQFLHYKKMKQLVHIGYTEEETKLQMLRDNTSVKMNAAQVGVVVAGEDLATWLKGLREHNLFLNHSQWSQKQKKQSAIERCIVESFVLSDNKKNWVDQYAKNNEFFISHDSADMRENYVDLITEFDEVISEYPELWDKLNKNNLYIIIAAYCHFCNINKNHSNKDFGKFLCDWFAEIKDTTDYDPKPNEDKSGTKHKTTVLGKLDIINSECQKYMEICEIVERYSDDALNSRENVAFDKVLEDFVENSGLTENEALSCLMELDNRCGCQGDFSAENIAKYKEFLRENVDENLISKCLDLQNEIINIPLNDEALIDTYNLPIVMKLCSKYSDTAATSKIFGEWLQAFADAEDCAFVEIGGKTFKEWSEDEINQTSNATIISKYAILQESFEKYMKENN